MNKKIITIAVIIITIILGVLVGIKLKNNKKTVLTSGVNENIQKTEDEVQEQKNEKNEITENEVNEITNTENMKNEINNEIVEEVEEEPKTDLEKAIDIVKKDWGEDNTVKFAEDGTTRDGEYIICVRDIETTNALAWYTVNVSKGTFVKE